jgi:hypothetical protein
MRMLTHGSSRLTKPPASLPTPTWTTRSRKRCCSTLLGFSGWVRITANCSWRDCFERRICAACITWDGTTGRRRFRLILMRSRLGDIAIRLRIAASSKRFFLSSCPRRRRNRQRRSNQMEKKRNSRWRYRALYSTIVKLIRQFLRWEATLRVIKNSHYLIRNWHRRHSPITRSSCRSRA